MSDRKEIEPDLRPPTQTGLFHEASGQELGERLQFLPHQPKQIVDIGFRASTLSRLLRSHFPDASVIPSDGSSIANPETEHKSTESAPQDGVSELEQMSLDAGSADLIVSNLSASFCDPKVFVAECYRILRANGTLLFSMFATRSFQEFRQACENSGIVQAHEKFPEMHDIGDLLLSSGFANPVVDIDCRRLRYPDIQSLIEVLERSGTFAALLCDSQLLSTKSVQSKLSKQFHDLDDDGNIMLTVDIIYGIAWKREIDTGTAHVHFHPA